MALLKIIASLLILLVLALVVGALMVFDNTPLPLETNALTPSDLRRARSVVASVYSEASISGEPSTIAFSESDIELLISAALSSQHGGKAKAEFIPDTIRLQMSAVMPENAFGNYLNMDLTLVKQQSMLSINKLVLGNLEVPGWLADNLLRTTHQELKTRVPEYATLLAAITDYSVEEDHLELAYSLQADVLDMLSGTGRDLFISEATIERLQAHNEQLLSLAEQFSSRSSVSLAEIMSPMFAFAHNRQGDASEENRAAILVMALQVLDIDISPMLKGASSPVSEVKKLRLTLYRRNDFAQHFLGSAALAISTEPGIANTIALLKEMDDSQQGGSGFSFTDLAADRAGIRFAELAVSDAATAQALQQLLGEALEESYFAYDFRQLPEFLDAQSFRETYKDSDSSVYQTVLNEIESNISDTPLFMQFR